MKTDTNYFDEFVTYVQSLCKKEDHDKIISLLTKFRTLAVRITLESSIPDNEDMEKWSDEQLAQQMQVHVVSRGGNAMQNSAWSMMLEAARRLNSQEELNTYRDAARYDALMEGPRFMGWNKSTLERARNLTRQALKEGRIK